MENAKIVTDVLSVNDMLAELPIKINQVRAYIKDGRLKAQKIRNKFYATRADFDEFKKRLGF